ncbi:hypothetical protein RUM43_010779, partial [Polyplax serrata]
ERGGVRSTTGPTRCRGSYKIKNGKTELFNDLFYLVKCALSKSLNQSVLNGKKSKVLHKWALDDSKL